MLTTEEIDAFKEAGYSFEEIQRIQQSLKNFEETGISYSKEEAFDMVNKEVFSKYMAHV
jgi:hypothetical protein